MLAIPKLNLAIKDASKLQVNPIEDKEILVNINDYFKPSQSTKPSLSDEEIKVLQQKQHLDPNAKKQLIGTSGIGSSKYADSSRNAGYQTTAEYNAKSRTSESNSVFSNMFSKLLTEDPDSIYELQGKPSNFKKGFKDKDAVTFSIIKGMYFQYDRPTYSEMLPITHLNIVDALQSACRSKNNLYKTFMRKIKTTNLHSFNVTEERLQELKRVIYYPFHVEREVFDVCGRVWTDVDIIAFWQTKKQISNEDLAILKSAIPMFNKSISNVNQLQVNPLEDDTKLITFDEYFQNTNNISSKYSDEEIKALQQKQHFDPKAKKKLIGTSSGIGSSKYADAARNAGYNTAAEFSHLRKVGESKFAEIFKHIL